MAGIVWSVTPSRAWGDLADDYVRRIRAGVWFIAQKWAPQIEAWMKHNAPWTDRTGNARQLLWARARQLTADMVEIVMAHGVVYGVFLELRHAGAYAIINPALDHFAPRIWADVVRMVQP